MLVSYHYLTNVKQEITLSKVLYNVEVCIKIAFELNILGIALG
jgi:hypothetical protein